MFIPSVYDIIRLAKQRNYPIFRNRGRFHYNLNIWGFRSIEKDTKEYNDSCVVFWQNMNNHWTIEYFKITTDPSDLLLENPINDKGTAILKEGHHKSMFSLGYHKGRKDHKCLVQSRPCLVYRDNDRNNRINDNLPLDRGMFGIDIHRASKVKDNKIIGLYSAGCQVFYNHSRFKNVFIPLCEESYNEGNTTFSYTLALQSWFDDLKQSKY